MEKMIMLCVFVLLSVGGTFATQCTADANCTAITGQTCSINGACTVGTCACPTGTILFNSSCVSPVAHGGACLSVGVTSNCGTLSAECNATSSTCGCPANNPTYYSNLDTCLPSGATVVTTLGGACNNTQYKYCTTDMTCGSGYTCECSLRAENGVCKKNRIIGSACSSDIDCTTYIPFAVCTNSTCSCPTNYTAGKTFPINSNYPILTSDLASLGGLDICVYNTNTEKTVGQACKVSSDGTTNVDVCASSAPYCVACGDTTLSGYAMRGLCSTAATVDGATGGSGGSGGGGSGAEVQTASLFFVALVGLSTMIL